MSMYPSLKNSVLALVLTCVAVGGAKAQDSGPTQQGFCTGGPFTLTAGEAKVHVAIDDVSGAPSSNVIVRLYNAQGTAVASKKVTLGAGRTTTLPYNGSGLLRAQAEFDVPANASARRRTTASVEVTDINNLKLILPVLCTVNENIGR